MQVNELFDRITVQMIADIEAGTATWRMPWHCLADLGTPVNADGRGYRGANSVLLPFAAAAHGWNSGIWATFNSWRRHGAFVRCGERGTHVILWKTTDRASEADDSADAAEPAQNRRGLVARTFVVFAAEQVDGADAVIARHSRRHVERDTPERIAAADAYFAATGLSIIEGGNRAYYSPDADEIHVPNLAQFDHASAFHSTVSHEAAHSTAHPSRIGRDLTGRFGSDAYAAEELVAELAAAMWCGQMGISAAIRTDHASYVGSWLRVLGQDAGALVSVAGKAQAAVDYLNTLAGYNVAPADAEAVSTT
jgi:antirestriction protein ArdC